MNAIKPKNTLKLKIKTQSLINSLTSLIRQLPNYAELRGDKELIIYLLNILSIEITDKYPTICPIEIIKQVYKDIFTDISQDELTSIEKDIEFFINNGLVKPTRYLKVINTISKLFKKKA